MDGARYCVDSQVFSVIFEFKEQGTANAGLVSTFALPFGKANFFRLPGRVYVLFQISCVAD